MTCPCTITAKFLESLGARHSAKMHLRPNAVWSVHDWKLHLDEEERILIPLLRKYGMGADADRILADHVIMRQQLDDWMAMDKKLVDRHAEFEDKCVLKLEQKMKAA